LTEHPVVPWLVTAYVIAPANDDAAANVTGDCGIVTAVVGDQLIVVVPRFTVNDCDTIGDAAR
jgi:hypothetical protein